MEAARLQKVGGGYEGEASAATGCRWRGLGGAPRASVEGQDERAGKRNQVRTKPGSRIHPSPA